jgi:hypothetical protein
MVKSIKKKEKKGLERNNVEKGMSLPKFSLYKGAREVDYHPWPLMSPTSTP